MKQSILNARREFLKDNIRLEFDFSQTDQHRGVAPPPIAQPCPPEGKKYDLPAAGRWEGVSRVDLSDAIAQRQSHRRFRRDAMTLDELAFLLWATQGIRKSAGPGMAFRTVPSAGCRHALETYVCAVNIQGLNRGIYRYLPLEHQLCRVADAENLPEDLVAATLGQTFVSRAALTLVWTAVPYRMEWRYGLASHKVIAIEAGHVCQNLYLACAAVGAGTCAIAAYHQQLMDRLLGVDGQEEFTVYLSPVGKI